MSPLSPQHFDVALDDRGLDVVVRVKGEVDAATAPQMGQVIDAQMARNRRVVLDLSRVDFMDLHGLAVLLRASRRARDDGGGFALDQPARCVMRLLELVHVESEIEILPDGADPLHAA
jgi:anti-anti-sigma factor